MRKQSVTEQPLLDRIITVDAISTQLSMDQLDAVLDFERECYLEGWQEGTEAGSIKGHTEGRELGIQTGFLRYLPVGILQARAEAWRKADVQHKALDNLTELADIRTLENEDADEVEHRIKLAKNKARTVAAATNSPALTAHDQKITYQREDAIEDI